MSIYPRIRGRVGQREDNNKWIYEIIVHAGPSNLIEPIELTSKEDFDTEKQAQEALKEMANEMAVDLCEKVYGKKPEGLIDMKTNEFTPIEQVRKH